MPRWMSARIHHPTVLVEAARLSPVPVLTEPPARLATLTRSKVWGPTLAAALTMPLAYLVAGRIGAFVDRGLLPLTDRAAVLTAVCLLVLPVALADRTRPVRGLVLAALLAGFAALVLPFILGRSDPVFHTLLAGALMVTVLTLAISATARLLVPFTQGPSAALGWVLATVLVLAAAPLWLADPLERGMPMADLLVAVNPLTALGLAGAVDYPRDNWFYRQSPLGGLRYAYPSLDCPVLRVPVHRHRRARRRPPAGRSRAPAVAGPDSPLCLPFGVSSMNRVLGPVRDSSFRVLVPAVFAALLVASPLTLGADKPAAATAQPAANAAQTPAAKPAEPAAKPGAVADAGLDPALVEPAKRAVDEGLHYLRGTQAADGSWSDSVGITALALRAFIESPRGYNEADGAFITRPVKFLLDHVNPDGSISETNQNRSYNTAVAVQALDATKNPSYAKAIAGAQQFLKDHQIDEGEGYDPSHAYYGGIGYGGDERPDLSNVYMAVEALHTTDLDPKDPSWAKALAFISRCQNNSETNDQTWAANDGGFTYMPGMSPHGGSGSYGGMTSAGLLSLLFAGVDKNDPRVKAAHDWIRGNYSVEESPGAKKGQGLYYYYNVFAKAMAAYGEPTLTDTQGATHNWRNDLAKKLIELRHPDGSWVNAESPRWWEGDPNLVTAWSVIALNQVLRKD